MRTRILAFALALVMLLGYIPIPAQAAKDDFSLATNKTSYAYGEDIIVTASGKDCWVGIYGAGETPGSIQSYCWYYTKNHNNKAVAIQGTEKNERFKKLDGVLPAGNYVVYLFQTANGSDFNQKLSKAITIEAATGTEELFTLSTNKTNYSYGEDILVTATGRDCWVGIYGVNDTYGKDQTSSYFWYNTSDYSGVATAIQKQKSNNRADVLPVGVYRIYLFQTANGSEYNVKKSVDITITDASLADLTSLTYVLDDATDGFANGKVTVTKASDNGATDCVLYWADASGTPLAGYTSLAKFKLTGTTTVHEMYSHTIIPAGAKKLIAYASRNGVLSQGYVAADLPSGSAFSLPASPLAEFQIVSDTHLTTNTGSAHNTHFAQLLEDVRVNSSGSLGIFINGDVTDGGTQAQYEVVKKLYQESVNKGLAAKLHLAIGNHDWNNGNPEGLFQSYVKTFNSAISSNLSRVYYDETVGGYNFIYLGSESSGLHANLSGTQLSWLDQRLAAITAANSDKPVFILLHQAVYNTVAGTLPGQGWNGVTQEVELKAILQKYPQAIIFGGHSHWELNSLQCLYPGDAGMSVAMNTASVGYLWSSYDVTAGEHMDGSHGYYVRVYDDYVLFLGRDIENSLFIPSAMFLVRRNKINAQSEYVANVGKASAMGVSTLDGGALTYASANTGIATVSADGKITGIKHGTTQITITAAPTDTTVVDRKTVTVDVHNVVNGKCTACDYKTHDCADGNKDHKCDTCGTVLSTCSGGTATCREAAVCTTCNKPYGSKNTSNHTQAASWTTKNATQHGKTYPCCGAVVVSVEKHHWSNGTCSECDYTCTHTGGTATCQAKPVCANCGMSYGSKDASNHTQAASWTTKNAIQHGKTHPCCGAVVVSVEKHHWNNGTCSECDYTCTHTGGTATCLAKPICTNCGSSYGSIDANAHVGTLKWTKTETTHKKAYENCDHVVVALERHEWVEGICGECGYACVHKDGDNNHLCDTCGKTVSTCENKNPTVDHSCDTCGTKIDTCYDTNPLDGKCDVCMVDVNHLHADRAPKDHRCDICAEPMGICSDSDPLDHRCDYGCGKTFGNCVDEELKDHKCDYGCGKTFGNCVDEEPKDHKCDYGCGKTFGNCVDEDPKDHKCDYGCGKTFGNCVDEDPKDHKCDYGCGKTFGSCVDEEPKDHKCDYGCGKTFGNCADEDPKDHKCDYGCGKTFGTCADEDEDHYCDVCGDQLSEIPKEPEETEPEETEPEEPEETEPEETLPEEPEATEPEEIQPEKTDVSRLAGENRFETALLAAEQMKKDMGIVCFEAVIVASGANFADALSGSYLAAVTNAPILLSYKDKQNDMAKEYIQDNLVPGGTVYILGGENAVPKSMESGLHEYKVVRLAGDNRFGTNLRILEEAGMKKDMPILVCTGSNFADSLSAAATGLPILLVHKTLTRDQIQFLEENGNAGVYIIGGESAVKSEIAEAIEDLGLDVTRLGGKNRFQTSVMIAETFFEDVDGAVLAYAMNFPDGLCGGAVAYAMRSPLILTATKYHQEAAGYLKDQSLERMLVLGGENLISQDTVEQILAKTE